MDPRATPSPSSVRPFCTAPGSGVHRRLRNRVQMHRTLSDGTCNDRQRSFATLNLHIVSCVSPPACLVYSPSARWIGQVSNVARMAWSHGEHQAERMRSIRYRNARDSCEAPGRRFHDWRFSCGTVRSSESNASILNRQKPVRLLACAGNQYEWLIYKNVKNCKINFVLQ